MLDNLKYAGTMHLTLRDEFGNVKDERHQKNVLLNVGKTYLIQTTMDTEATAMTVFYVGITNTADGGEVATDTTASTNEIWRGAFTYVSGATVGKASATATIGASGAGGATTTGIREAGIFNGAAATSGDGVFFCRTIFTAVNKGASDSLEIKWDIAYS